MPPVPLPSSVSAACEPGQGLPKPCATRIAFARATAAHLCVACSLVHVLPPPPTHMGAVPEPLLSHRPCSPDYRGLPRPLQPMPLPQPPASVRGIFCKCHLDRWVFSHLLMSNLAFAETLERLWDPGRVVTDTLLSLFLLRVWEMGMGFAKDSLPKAVPTAPTLCPELAQVSRAHGERSLAGSCPPAPLRGTLGLCCSLLCPCCRVFVSITSFP